MKEYVIVILLALVLDLSLDAQTDMFFMHNENRYIIGNGEGYEMLLLPEQHGLDYNYCADKVPLESGCLLLLGMCLAYAKFKKQV